MDHGEEAAAQFEAGAEEQAQAETQAAEAESETPEAPRVTYLGLSRLFNLGNYENIKFDVSVEIPKGQSAAETLVMLMQIMQRLRPIKVTHEVTNALEQLGTPESELMEYEREHLADYRAIVAKHNRRIQERKEALQKLDHLGGSTTHKDAKVSWQEDFEDWED